MDDDANAVTPTRDENSDVDHSIDEVANSNDNDDHNEDVSGEVNLEDNGIGSPSHGRDVEEEDLGVEDKQNEEILNSPTTPQSVSEDNVESPGIEKTGERISDESESREDDDKVEKEVGDDATCEPEKESNADGNVSNFRYEENQTEEKSSDIENDVENNSDNVSENLEDSETMNNTSQEDIDNTQSSRTSFENAAETSNQQDLQTSPFADIQSVGSVNDEGSVSQDQFLDRSSQEGHSDVEAFSPYLTSHDHSHRRSRNIEGSDIESDEDNEWDGDQSRQPVEEGETVDDTTQDSVRENEDSMDVGENSGLNVMRGTDDVSSEDENETQSNEVSQSEFSQGNEEEKGGEDEGEIVDKEEMVDNPLSPAEDISESEAGELSDNEEEEEEKDVGKAKIQDEEEDWNLDLTKQGDNVQSDRPLADAEDINSPESDLQEREKTPIRDLESAASPISEDGNLSDIDMEKRRREMYNDISDEEDSFSDDGKVDDYKVDSVVKESIKSSDMASKRPEVKRDRKVEKFHSQTSMGEEQVELDYDEEVGEEEGRGHEDKEKIDDSRAGENEVEKKEAEEGEAHSDDGELDDDEDCEEGEIREPGSRKPFIPPICRFFTRGACTWGNNCRFLHPGVNDKGNYRMIERPGFGPASYGQGSGPWQGPGEKPAVEEVEEEELPPPPMPPKVETAWERGLRHAKEQLKKANMRKEQETDFEHKRLNLSVEEEREFNKENDRYKTLHRDPYYDQYDDEYYDKLPSKRSPSPIGWQRGQYENFEVRWTREPEWVPPPVSHYHREREHHKFIRESFPGRHPAERFERKPSSQRSKPWVEEPAPRETRDAPVHRHTADVWHDPWRRSKSPKKKPRGSRSRSRGRRRSRRSYSYSSSFSSGSFSGSSRSRSRSSSYSSYSSRSGSRTSSSSRSPTRSPMKRIGGPHGRQPPGKQDGGKPRSAISGQPRQPGPIRRQPSQNQGGPPGKVPPGGPLLGRQRSQPGIPGAPQQDPNRGRVPKNKPEPPSLQQPPQRPQGPPQRPGRQSRGHRSSSGSRSRSRSSSSGSSRSSSASSVSSASSHSSSSSSGSADSEHLYRGVGGAKEGSPVSPKKKKAKTGKGPQPGKVERKPAAPVGSRSSRGSRNEPSQAPVTSKPKDPLKVVGSKQNIKLTLLNKPMEKDKPGGMVSKKRPSIDVDAPPAKRPALSAPVPSKPDKKVKKPEKPVVAAPLSPTKTASKPTLPTKNPPKGPPAATSAPKEKKSTSSRREELLKQLKAVEDAIARKRSKLN
ncbi:zinc finger CCCH domain-containing protein 18-like [Saccostrea echinata]|uniref:zinc finger CCCH domain-containing protein 18-like n=1 Tax=Saccostrea echinata TaxID=191078 RepID=UPI002A809188|nr:zinc finger CCCH domain-containing protein 18-like [Saccostrea echinata]